LCSPGKRKKGSLAQKKKKKKKKYSKKKKKKKTASPYSRGRFFSQILEKNSPSKKDSA